MGHLVAIRKLERIAVLLDDALALADDAQETLLAACLADSRAKTDQRLAILRASDS